MLIVAEERLRQTPSTPFQTGNRRKVTGNVKLLRKSQEVLEFSRVKMATTRHKNTPSAVAAGVTRLSLRANRYTFRDSYSESQQPPAKPEAWNNEWLKAIRPLGSTAAPDSETGASHRSSLLRSPLTPALSRGEREKTSPPGEGSSALDGSQWVRLLFPLPPGEGQGEGEP